MHIDLPQKPFLDPRLKFLLSPGNEEGEVTELSFILRNEVVRFDPDRIGALESEIGPEATEDVLYEATERLVDKLVELRAAYDSDRPSQVAQIADAMAQISDRVGLVTIARVACDVVATALEGNCAAYHATTARLIRVGEGCVTGAFEFSDQQI